MEGNMLVDCKSHFYKAIRSAASTFALSSLDSHGSQGLVGYSALDKIDALLTR